jgi:hypothetical protein
VNDIDTMLREVLESHAATVTAKPDLAARATRRSRQIRHRRVVAAGATTAAVVGVTSIAAPGVISRVGRSPSGHQGVVSVGVAATRTARATSTSTPEPSPTPGFFAPCPDGRTPTVSATGGTTASGDVPANSGENTVQRVIQSYLTDIANQTPINGYGMGTDAITGRPVVWIRFQNRSVIELVTHDSQREWSSYEATLGACATSAS